MEFEALWNRSKPGGLGHSHLIRREVVNAIDWIDWRLRLRRRPEKRRFTSNSVLRN